MSSPQEGSQTPEKEETTFLPPLTPVSPPPQNTSPQPSFNPNQQVALYLRGTQPPPELPRELGRDQRCPGPGVSSPSGPQREEGSHPGPQAKTSFLAWPEAGQIGPPTPPPRPPPPHPRRRAPSSPSL